MADTAIGGAARTGFGWGVKGLVFGAILGGLLFGGVAGVVAFFGIKALAVAAGWQVASAVTAGAWGAGILGGAAAIFGGMKGAVMTATYGAVLGAIKGGLTSGGRRDQAPQPEITDMLMQQNSMLQERLAASEARQKAALCGDNEVTGDKAAKEAARRAAAQQQETQRA